MKVSSLALAIAGRPSLAINALRLESGITLIPEKLSRVLGKITAYDQSGRVVKVRIVPRLLNKRALESWVNEILDSSGRNF